MRLGKGLGGKRGVPRAPLISPASVAPCTTLVVNQTLPDINGIKQAAAAEESIVALLGRLFEVVAVTIMTIYGLKAVIVGAHDFPTFVQFFFQVQPRSLQPPPPPPPPPGEP